MNIYNKTNITKTSSDGCKLDPELCQMTEEDQDLDLTQE